MPASGDLLLLHHQLDESAVWSRPWLEMLTERRRWSHAFSIRYIHKLIPSRLVTSLSKPDGILQMIYLACLKSRTKPGVIHKIIRSWKNCSFAGGKIFLLASAYINIASTVPLKGRLFRFFLVSLILQLVEELGTGLLLLGIRNTIVAKGNLWVMIIAACSSAGSFSVALANMCEQSEAPEEDNESRSSELSRDLQYITIILLCLYFTFAGAPESSELIHGFCWIDRFGRSRIFGTFFARYSLLSRCLSRAISVPDITLFDWMWIRASLLPSVDRSLSCVFLLIRVSCTMLYVLMMSFLLRGQAILCGLYSLMAFGLTCCAFKYLCFLAGLSVATLSFARKSKTIQSFAGCSPSLPECLRRLFASLEYFQFSIWDRRFGLHCCSCVYIYQKSQTEQFITLLGLWQRDSRSSSLVSIHFAGICWWHFPIERILRSYSFSSVTSAFWGERYPTFFIHVVRRVVYLVHVSKWIREFQGFILWPEYRSSGTTATDYDENFWKSGCLIMAIIRELRRERISRQK